MSFAPRDFNKQLHELDLDDIIYKHVGRRPESPLDFQLLSTLDVIEENMRHTKVNNKSEVFAPSLCAFAILEQIGATYFDRKVAAGAKHNGIKAALHNFCGINYDSAESHHLYRFRNAIMHDASMTNIWIARSRIRGFIYFDILMKLRVLSSRLNRRGMARLQQYQMILRLLSIKVILSKVRQTQYRRSAIYFSIDDKI